VWAQEGRRRLGWRPLARNPSHGELGLRRNADSEIRDLERRLAAGDGTARVPLAWARFRAGILNVEDGEVLLRAGDLSVLPKLIELWRESGRMDTAWDYRGAVELWRGNVTGRPYSLLEGLAGRQVEAVSIMTPRPNRAGWTDPRVATLIHVIGFHGPGWAEVWCDGPLATRGDVDGIPEWIGRLMHTSRLIPGASRRRSRRPQS